MSVLTIIVKPSKMTQRGQMWDVFHEGELILSNLYPFNKATRFFLDAGHPSYTTLEMYHEGEKTPACSGTLGPSGRRRLVELQSGFAWIKWEGGY